MKVIIHGYTGKMGHMLEEAIAQNDNFEIAAEAAFNSTEEKEHTYNSLKKVKEDADVLIDFSNHVTTKDVCDFARDRKMPALICTTGQTEKEKKEIENLSKEVPVFYSGNMSLGIAVLTDLVKEAVKMFPDADVEIVEKHHNQKLDVPSGTALMLADAVKEEREDAVLNIGRHENGKRKKNEIGIHSLRMGSEVGTHEVYIATDNEVLTLTHQAKSRAVFADGALKAAEFLVKQKPGLYSMKELVNQ